MLQNPVYRFDRTPSQDTHVSFFHLFFFKRLLVPVHPLGSPYPTQPACGLQRRLVAAGAVQARGARLAGRGGPERVIVAGWMPSPQ